MIHTLTYDPIGQFIPYQISGIACNQRQIERWIRAVAAKHGYSIGNITYIFCNDTQILAINQKFLQHDYYTDIITFDYTTETCLHGDIFISEDTVRTNAEQVGQTYEQEMYRVIIHGILHLCGINDKGPGEREIMEREENHALQLLETMTQHNP